MSLLPRIPCRKLLIDSRFALPGGTATKFSVEIPQGGLDLPDNCIMIIPEISIPSFPNCFDGRNNLYYWEESADIIQIKYTPIPQKNYGVSDFATAIETALQAARDAAFTNSYDVSPASQHAGSDVLYKDLIFKLTGTNADQQAHILTDDELNCLLYTSPSPRDS